MGWEESSCAQGVGLEHSPSLQILVRQRLRSLAMVMLPPSGEEELPPPPRPHRLETRTSRLPTKGGRRGLGVCLLAAQVNKIQCLHPAGSWTLGYRLVFGDWLRAGIGLGPLERCMM